MALCEQSKNELLLDELLVDEICQKLFNASTAASVSCTTEKNSSVTKETRMRQGQAAGRQPGRPGASRADSEARGLRAGPGPAAQTGARTREELQTLLI